MIKQVLIPEIEGNRKLKCIESSQLAGEAVFPNQAFSVPEVRLSQTVNFNCTRRNIEQEGRSLC
jgi:hypothetical protein